MQSPPQSAKLPERRAFQLLARCCFLAILVTLLLNWNVPLGMAQDESADGEAQTEDVAPEAETPAESANEETWTTDATAAVTVASEESRDMMLLFTGSDWCAPCIQLEKTILSKAAFYDAAKEKFVMVKFDFPENTPLPEELRQQNEEWSNRYGIEGFPTIALVDEQQRPYAFTGLRDEGPEAYWTHVEELQQARVTRDDFLKQAADATGLDRANFLDEALSALDSNVVEVYYSEIVDEIGELDKEDEAGLRTKYFAARDREIRKAVMSNIAMVSRLRKPEHAIEFIDASLAEHKLPVEMWLVVQTTKLRLLRKLARVDVANQLIDEMITLEDISADTRQRLAINKAYYLISLNEKDAAFDELEKHISGSPENLLLTIAKGELHDSLGNFDEAIKAYNQSIMAAASRPDLLVEVVGAKADAQFELKLVDQSLATLDGVVNNESVPGKFRAEALLHKALILRETGRRRAAILAENKAVEIVESIDDKAEIQKLVDQFRRKFDKTSEGG